MNITKTQTNNNTSLYTNGLLVTADRKTATNLAKSLNVKHDKLYRELTNTQEENLLNKLKVLAQQTFQNNPLYLLFDDTRLTKRYASNIEGLDIGHDGSTNSITKGIQMVTAMFATAEIKLPIDIQPYISKWLSEDYITKSNIAWDIVQRLIASFNIARILADAHYATKTLLRKLIESGILFLMKIPRNRKVVIHGKHDQLQRLLRLKRNEHVRYAVGFYDDIRYFFYVVKVGQGKTVYLISSDFIEPKELINLYRIRWEIELFHRTAKQKLGLGDCQSTSLKKQIRHCLFVMIAYCLAELKRHKLKMQNIEEAIESFRIVKFNKVVYRKRTSIQNFGCYA